MDEWTMICPPGKLAIGELLEPTCGVNVREIVESPYAEAFLLVNDAQLDAFWHEPFQLQLIHPLPLTRDYHLPIIHVAPSMVRITGT